MLNVAYIYVGKLGYVYKLNHNMNTFITWNKAETATKRQNEKTKNRKHKSFIILWFIMSAAVQLNAHKS